MIWSQYFANSSFKYKHKPFLANNCKLYVTFLFLSSFFFILPQTQLLGFRILTQIFKFHFLYSHCSVIKLRIEWFLSDPCKSQWVSGESIFMLLHSLRHHEYILCKKQITTSSFTGPTIIWTTCLESKMPALLPFRTWHLVHLHSHVNIHSRVLTCPP